MIFMIFMLFGAFDVVVQRPCRPGSLIDRIISRRPLIHGTWHIRLEALSSAAADASGRHCACGGVFVVLFVVDDEDNTNSFNFAPASEFLSFALSSMTMKPIQLNHVAPSATSLSFAPSLMTMNPIRFNHVGNQHGLPFIGLL